MAVRRTVHALLLSALLVFITASCSKESFSPEIIEIKIAGSGSIRSIINIGDSIIYAAGGIKNSFGILLRSLDMGNSWHELIRIQDSCIYTVAFRNENEGFIGGDKLLLRRTNDAGANWSNAIASMTFAGWEEYITAFRSIDFTNDNNIFAVGGDYYSHGIIFRSDDNGSNWGNMNYDNQFSKLMFTGNDNGIIAGNGVIYTSSDSCKTLDPCDIRDDFFTGISFPDMNNGFACGYDGSLYRSNDAGRTWTQILDGNNLFGKRIHFNDIYFSDPQNGFVCGSNGLLMKTTNAGEDWEYAEKRTNSDFHCICPYYPNSILIGGDNGCIYKVW